jgi:hypothetical protein
VTTHVLFVQGAGDGSYVEDQRLVDSLQRALGSGFAVHYPPMPDEENAPYEEWRDLIAQRLRELPVRVVMVGHSVGASVLLRWLSEGAPDEAMLGVFLIAGPFWGGDGWHYEGYEELELVPGIADRLRPDLPVVLYHCRDDAVVPFAHLALFAHEIPGATIRAYDTGGHQLNDDLTPVAMDISSLL